MGWHGQDGRQRISAFASTVISHCQPRRWTEEGSAGHEGGACFLGMQEATVRAGPFMAQRRFQQLKAGKAALDSSQPTGVTLDGARTEEERRRWTQNH